MGRRTIVDPDYERRARAIAANIEIGMGWLREFELSDPFTKLYPAAQRSLDGAVRILARSFTHRWSALAATRYPLNEMTPEDAIDILTEQLPRTVSAMDPDVFVDGLTGLLVWAAKIGRLRDRNIEYACRNNHHAARAAMMESRKWSPAKAIVMDAMGDGIDPADMGQVREHAIRRGLDPRYVDEFLPPGPILLKSGNWLGLLE
jgi:hypothetical protein